MYYKNGYPDAPLPKRENPVNELFNRLVGMESKARKILAIIEKKQQITNKQNLSK